MTQVEGSLSGGERPSGPGGKETAAKKGQEQLSSGGKKTKRGDGSVFNATIVAETISFVTTRNGKRSRRISIPPWERLAQLPSPIWMGHRDRTLGQTVEDREGGDREMQQ